MQDASEQHNNAQFNQVLQSSPLNQRLARRSTESVGVVHLKPFQSQYVRMPGWMVQRSTLLEQLQTRYGTRKEGTGETSDMVLASVMPQPPQAQLNSAPLPASLDAMPQPTAPIRGKLPTPPSPSPPANQFRVSRRVALPPDTSSSAKVTSSSISSDSSEPVVRSQILPNNISDNTPQLVPKISEIGGAGGAEVSLVLRKVASVPSEGLVEPLMPTTEQPSNLAGNPTPTSGGNIIASAVQPHSSSSVSPTDAIVPSSPKLESPISMPGRGTQGPLVLRKAASVKLDDSLGQSIVGKSQFISNSENPASLGSLSISRAEILTQSSNLREVEGTNQQGFHAGVTEKTNVPLILRQAVPMKPGELSKENAIAKKATLPPQVKEIKVSSTRTQSPETLPLVQTASTSMRLELQQEQSSTATKVDTPNSQRMAVAAEIPVQKTTLSQRGIVWRKSANESSSGMPLGSQFSRDDKNALPLAINLRNGNEQIARQSISASSSMPQTSTEMGNSMSADAGSLPTPIPTSASQVNVAQIAEQVSRILSRQLIVERERRGMN